MNKQFFTGAVSCFMLAYLLSCSNNDVTIAGNGTRIGNPAIMGMLYESDGKTPASNAVVCLRKKDALPDIGLNKTKTDITMVTTNTNGEFEIDSADSGTYIIECKDNNDNLALYDSVVVKCNDTTVLLPANTLKPAGVINGTIILPVDGDFGRIYVLVFGVQRFSIVDSSGKFYLDDLAEGSYDLRIISSLENYQRFDTMSIPVVSGDTTSINIDMLYNGIPVVKNLLLEHYDTLSNVVTLSWNKTGSSHVKGYNVYKKNKYKTSKALFFGTEYGALETTGDEFRKINQKPITDTIYRDSGMIQNHVYSYVVTAIDDNSKESLKSNEVSAVIATPFVADTLIEKEFGNYSELKGCNPQKILFENESFYVVSDNQVHIYDTLFNKIGVLDNIPSRPFEIAADNSGRIYVSIVNFDCNEMPGSLTSILVFDHNVLVKKLNLTDTLDSIPPIGIEASLFTVSNNGNIIFVKNTKDTVYICDSTGLLLKKVGDISTINYEYGTCDGIASLTTDNYNNIYLYDNNEELQIRRIIVLDEDGIQKRRIDTDGGSLYHKITIDSNGTIYFVGEALQILSPEGKIITNLHSLSCYENDPDGEFIALLNAEIDHIVLQDKKMYVFDAHGVIKYTNNLR